MQLIKELYPNAVTFVGEILPHPSNQTMNNGVRNANCLLHEEYPNYYEKIRFFELPVCKVDNAPYDADGVHLNKSLVTKQLLKEFSRASNTSRGRKPFMTRSN